MLSYEKAQKLYEALDRGSVNFDELEKYAFNMMVKAAVRYTKIRAEWYSYPLEERAALDQDRISAHDKFISMINTIASMQGEHGKKWRDKLGNRRKELGDFACYISLFRGLMAR